MGQYRDSSVQPALQALTVNIGYLLFGLFGWEYILSFQVEYALLSRRLPFRLSLVPYILGRACLLMLFILVTVGTSVRVGNINCLPGLYTIAVLGNTSLGCATTNFTIRTWVIWKDSRFVHALLSVLALGQWALLILAVALLKGAEVDGTCMVYDDHPRVSVAILIYTGCYDLLVFVLLVVGLSRERSESPLKRRLRVQGIMYLAISGISYIPCMVAYLIGGSAGAIIWTYVALTVSTIASSRAVRSLRSFDESRDTTGNSRSLETSHVALTTQIGIPMVHAESGLESVDKS